MKIAQVPGLAVYQLFTTTQEQIIASVRGLLEMIVEAIYLQEDDLGKGAIKLFDVNNAQRWTKMRHSTFVPNLVSDMQLPSAVKQL